MAHCGSVIYPAFLMRPITHQERRVLCIKPDAEVYVSDEDPDSMPTYNCLGSVLGVRWMLKPAPWSGDTPIGFLKRVGLRPHHTKAPEKQIALYRGQNLSRWHVAKHIGFDWWESKCHEGQRIVHRLDCFLDEGYGTAESFWEFDASEEANRKLTQALLEDAEGYFEGSAEERRMKAQAYVREMEHVFDSKPPA